MTKWKGEAITELQKDKEGCLRNGAYLDSDSFMRYYKDGKIHKEDGPAVIGLNGYGEWWFEGKKHRVDGPALDWEYCDSEWWIHGIQYSEEEFKLFLENKELNKSLNTHLEEKENKSKRKI